MRKNHFIKTYVDFTDHHLEYAVRKCHSRIEATSGKAENIPHVLH
jgi:hypothetical protein